MSLTLDPKKIHGAPDDELSQVQHELGQMAAISFRKGLAIVSLICNVEKTSEILMRVRRLASGPFALPTLLGLHCYSAQHSVPGAESYEVSALRARWRRTRPAGSLSPLYRTSARR